MTVMEKIWLNNFREALTLNDKMFYDFMTNNKKKNSHLIQLVYRLNTGEEPKDLRKRCIKRIENEIKLLNKLIVSDLKRIIIYKVLDNLKSHHNVSDKGVIYDTSNFKFIEHYRGEKALSEAKKLLTSEIRHLPEHLEKFFSHADGHKKLIYKPYNIAKIKKYLKEILDNSIKQLKLISTIKSKSSTIIHTKHSEKSVMNLLEYYMTSIVRQLIIEIQLYNSKKTLKKIINKPRKSFFFVFGGMEKRYTSLMSLLMKELKAKHKTRVHKISKFMYLMRYETHDLYFITCIGPSPRYYPPYYYSPTADEIAKFMKYNIGEKNISKVILFGVCGSFSDNRGAVYLPKRIGNLFYNFEKRVNENDIISIKKSYIKINNFLDCIVKGKKVDIFTCSTLFNDSIVEVPYSDYKQLKKTIEADINVPNSEKKRFLLNEIKEYKKRKIDDFSRLIKEKGIADGVEMESYVFAERFGNKFGVYLEVSDNVLKAEEVSFNMKQFHKNVCSNFMKIVENLIQETKKPKKCKF